MNPRIKALREQAEAGDGSVYPELDELAADDDAILADAARDAMDIAAEALCEAAGSFTCNEADAIAALLDASGSNFTNDFRERHAAGDDEDDNHFVSRTRSI